MRQHRPGTGSALFLMILTGVTLGATPATGGTRGGMACFTSAQQIQRACLARAGDDYWTALATCANLPAAEARSCGEVARDTLREANADCADQYDARVELCQALGGGAYQPVIDPHGFVAGVNNPLFPLAPGTTWVYEAHGSEGFERDVVTVTHETKTILDVDCVVVSDRLTLDGVLKEETFDWYAQDVAGNVWYFGEDSRSYEDGDLVSIEGSWKAGRDGALPGIVMEAHPKTGDLYRQEFLAGTAEDFAKVVSLDRAVAVPAGTFNHCVATHDSSPFDGDEFESKFYAADVGTVLEIEADGTRVELVSFTKP
ncbi:MAG TPA: hypothetical protein VMQ62_03210 [Dongiaceae bacterium]|nr:hypothetical protein [Dongiaceae bacterium]